MFGGAGRKEVALAVVTLLVGALGGGCSKSSVRSVEPVAQSAGRNGHLVSMTPMYPGMSVYSLKYWSRGNLIQAYVDVPSGKGPFPILVVLHGGWLDASSLHHVSQWNGVRTSFTPYIAAQWASYNMIVLLPNYAGYGPSKGTVSTPLQNALDTLNGISALRQICGLRIKSEGTYLLGYSMGGDVAIYVAQRDRDVQTAVLLSPAVMNYWETHKFQIHVPVLLLAGAQDNVMPPTVEEDAYSILRTHDATVRFILEPGGHVPLTGSWDDMLAWFAKYGLPFVVHQSAPRMKMCNAS